MKAIKKNILKLFLSICLGLTVATMVFASRPPSPPGPPGRPSACAIEADWAQLRFKKSRTDGGSPITFYRVEYKDLRTGKWCLERTVKPTFSIEDMVQCTVDNRVGTAPVVFRAFANNVAGLSKPSLASDPITFRDPF